MVTHGEAERIQRREWARVDTILPISVQGIDEPIGGDTTTLNISGGGVLVSDKWNMPLGTDVRIELHADAAGPADPRDGPRRARRGQGREGHPHRLDRPRGRRAPGAPRARARAGRPADVEGPMSRRRSRRRDARTRQEAEEGQGAEGAKGQGQEGQGRGRRAGRKALAISIPAHPRAQRSIRRIRARTAIAAFVLVLILSHRSGVPNQEAVMRALLAGLIGNLAGWACALAVWRQL